MTEKEFTIINDFLNRAASDCLPLLVFLSNFNYEIIQISLFPPSIRLNFNSLTTESFSFNRSAGNDFGFPDQFDRITIIQVEPILSAFPTGRFSLILIQFVRDFIQNVEFVLKLPYHFKDKSLFLFECP